MYRIFLTREQYDLMVTRLHSWVKANWLTLDRAWTLNGVSVQCQTQDQLAVLAGHVAKCGGSARSTATMSRRELGETKMKTTIGQIEISIESVRHTRTNKEEGGNWYEGIASVEWMGTVGGSDYRHDVEVKVGCWDDTDDDHAEWAAWQEGARVIERCLGGTGNGDMRGTATQFAFRSESEELGAAICSMIREAAQSPELVAYAE